MSVFLVFPYFLESQVVASLPTLAMMDYQVDYDNHPIYSKGVVSLYSPILSLVLFSHSLPCTIPPFSCTIRPFSPLYYSRTLYYAHILLCTILSFSPQYYHTQYYSLTFSPAFSSILSHILSLVLSSHSLYYSQSLPCFTLTIFPSSPGVLQGPRG